MLVNLCDLKMLLNHERLINMLLIISTVYNRDDAVLQFRFPQYSLTFKL